MDKYSFLDAIFMSHQQPWLEVQSFTAVLVELVQSETMRMLPSAGWTKDMGFRSQNNFMSCMCCNFIVKILL